MKMVMVVYHYPQDNYISFGISPLIFIFLYIYIF